MKALITGITGQDGSYLAELLLIKGYEVHGVIRRHSTTAGTVRIDHIFDRLHLHYGDMTDGLAILSLVQTVRPDEIYHLAAQSHVGVSFDHPCYTVDTNAIGTLNMLEALRMADWPCRYYQASSSEMFGSAPPPQSESTPFEPCSPYACSKVYGYYQSINYRKAYGLFACNGILFNHESPRRGETFVTRKITRAAARIALGLQDKLVLGDLTPMRDWGFAGDYVRAMWLMLQQDEPDDYVIATGEQHSVEQFLGWAFDAVNLDWRKHVKFDERYSRPLDVPSLCGDASKARMLLGWEPTVDIAGLVGMMVAGDLELAEQERTLRDVKDSFDWRKRDGGPELLTCSVAGQGPFGIGPVEC